MPFYCVGHGSDMNSSLSNGEFKCLVRVILFGPLVSESFLFNTTRCNEITKNQRHLMDN